MRRFKWPNIKKQVRSVLKDQKISMPSHSSHNHSESHDDTAFFYQLAYCSVLTQDLNAVATHQIIEQSRRNNAANGITGMLMIDNGLVIQWLEGSKAQVRKLWATLQDDPRHHCLVELLHRDFADERLFPDWTMQRATREEMLAIVHSAREQAEAGEPSPWADAIATLCMLIDPDYAALCEEGWQHLVAPVAEFKPRALRTFNA